jgi:hypothetical protein
MKSSKEHFSQERASIDPKVSKKLWGSLSISDVAHCMERSYKNGGFGIEGYEIKPNQRFNLQIRSKVPQSKMKRYID